MSTSINTTDKPTRYCLVAYITVLFAAPFSSGSPLHILYFIICVTAFIVYVYWFLPRPSYSLLGYIKQQLPSVYYALLAFLAVAVISFARVMVVESNTYHQLLAFMQAIVYCLISCYLFALVKFIQLEKLNPLHVFMAYMFGVLVLISELLIFYHVFDAPNIDLWLMFPPVGGHMRLMGMAAAVAVLCNCLFLLFYHAKSRLLTLLLIVINPLLVAFLLWTGSRASIFLLLVCLAFLCLLQLYYKKFSFVRWLLLVCLSVCAVPIAEKVSVQPYMGLHRVVESSQLLSTPAITQTENMNAVTSGRVVIWQLSLEAFTRQPWLGYGPNGYFFLPERLQDFIHPHNVIIQFLLEWGVLGGGLLLFILAAMALKVLSHIPANVRTQNVAYLMPAFVVLLLCANSLTDGVFFVTEPLFCIATAIGLLLASSPTNKHIQETV